MVRVRRHQHLLEIADRVLTERDVAHLGRPAEVDRRNHHHHGAQPEARDGEQQNGERTRDVVAGGVLADGRIHADRHGDGQANQNREQAELKGDWQALGQTLGHGRGLPQ
jgi:hypothetical protein